MSHAAGGDASDDAIGAKSLADEIGGFGGVWGFEEVAGLFVAGKQFEDLLSQVGVVGAVLLEEAGAVLGGQVDGGGEEFLELLPAVVGGGVGAHGVCVVRLSSCCRSQARARVHSRSTVRAEMQRAAAIS